MVVSHHAKFQLITKTGSRFFRTVFAEILRPPLLALVPEAGLRISGSDIRGSPQTTVRLHSVTCRGKYNCCRGKISCQLFAIRPCSFVAAAVMKGITCAVQCYNNKSKPPSWYFASPKPYCERTRNGKMDNVRTHTQCNFQPERYFCRLI